jgi:UDP-N-acetylmuramate dehydrogenase
MPSREAGRRLAEALPGDVRLDEPMSRHTTYRIGGPADVFVMVETLAGLASALDILAEEEVPHTVVGKGSNLLVADAGYRGAVLVLGREFRRHSFDGPWLQAGAGCILATVVQDAYRRGLAGLVFAVGVPGTVGGALAMNAGGKDAWIGAVVDSVTLFVPGQGLARLRGSEVAWGYRSSGLARRGIIVESALKLAEGDADMIRRDMERTFATRKSSQPIAARSAGSVFVNPEGDSAGRLIEAAGLKGARLGGARVSKVHANFIVNDGVASAKDVAGLIRKVQMTVKDLNGIELRPEVRFLGEFDSE